MQYIIFSWFWSLLLLDLYIIVLVANLKPSIKKLQRHVIPFVAAKWYELGVELLDEGEEHKLKTIKSDHKNDAIKCCFEMFCLWLDSHTDATWQKIFEALKSPGVGLASLVPNLEKKLLGKA